MLFCVLNAILLPIWLYNKKYNINVLFCVLSVINAILLPSTSYCFYTNVTSSSSPCLVCSGHSSLQPTMDAASGTPCKPPSTALPPSGYERQTCLSTFAARLRKTSPPRLLWSSSLGSVVKRLGTKCIYYIQHELYSPPSSSFNPTHRCIHLGQGSLPSGSRRTSGGSGGRGGSGGSCSALIEHVHNSVYTGKKDSIVTHSTSHTRLG